MANNIALCNQKCIAACQCLPNTLYACVPPEKSESGEARFYLVYLVSCTKLMFLYYAYSVWCKKGGGVVGILCLVDEFDLYRL